MFAGFQKRVRQCVEPVQAAEEEEGPQRAKAAAVRLLPLLSGGTTEGERSKS